MKALITSIVMAVASTVSHSDTLSVGQSIVEYDVRNSQFNSAVSKLNLDIEVSLVDERLPTKRELKAVSDLVLPSQPNAKTKWVFFFLPEMESGSGAYATDHRAPEPEGIKIIKYMLINTPYKHLVK